jgi:hypothetical protein
MMDGIEITVTRLPGGSMSADAQGPATVLATARLVGIASPAAIAAATASTSPPWPRRRSRPGSGVASSPAAATTTSGALSKGPPPGRRTLAKAHIGNLSSLAAASDYQVAASEGANPLTGIPAWTGRGLLHQHDRRQSVWALVAKAAAWEAEKQS